MKNLERTTFIIPIKIEHPDRYRNAKTVLSFLNHHFKTNVFIYEISDSGTKLDFLNSLSNLNIKHWVSEPEDAFHRTKYLNIMLDEVETPVVSNYDIDVILDPDLYLECQSDVLEGNFDVVYPYHYGYDYHGQKMVYPNINLDEFRDSGYETSYITERSHIFQNYYSEYGHCIFFKTRVYKEYGGENESFVSYGPEDKERGERFQKMGFNVNWLSDCRVYHFEHYRGMDSSELNPNSKKNWDVFDKCKTMDKQQTIKYYKNQGYNKKYKTIGKW